MKFSPYIFFCLYLSSGCSDPDPAPARDLPSVEFGFETSFEDWIALGGSGERQFDDDITLSSDYAYEGQQSVRFRVTPESYIAKGVRAELTFDQGAREGDESWYEWSLLIPPGYTDTFLEDSTGAPNWQVMGQWHQQPQDGETWENFSEAGKSVPLAINYYYFDNQDPEYQKIKEDQRIREVPGFDPAWDQVSVLGLSVGDPPVTAALHQIEKGRWYRIKLHIRWSQEADGFVEAWINDRPWSEGRHHGQNMLNAASHYFKFGLYRNPTLSFDQVVYYDNIRIY